MDLAQQRQILLRVLQRAQLERKAAEMAVLAVLAPLTPDAWTAERGYGSLEKGWATGCEHVVQSQGPR